MKKAYTILIQGRVQGVGFRWFTQQNAQRFSIEGHVINLDSGDVEVFAQGDEENIQEFMAQLKKGPSFARVTNVIINDENINNNLNYFKVKH
jgi:acylphosphatase